MKPKFNAAFWSRHRLMPVPLRLKFTSREIGYWKKGQRWPVAEIEYSLHHRDGGLYVLWARSFRRGLAARLMLVLAKKLQPDHISLSPVTWSGVYFVKKLKSLHKQGKLPPIRWEYHKAFDWKWMDDGPEPDYRRLVKILGASRGR